MQGGSDSEESACNTGDLGLILRGWEGFPQKGVAAYSLFLPGESYGQRTLAGHSPWGRKESNTTEQLTLSHFMVWSVE